MRDPFVSRILSRVAERIGARVELEPEFGFAGRIIFANGRTHVFRANNLNINRAGAVAVCEDKAYTSYFLRTSGFRTPRELTFFSNRLSRNLPVRSRRSVEDACRFAEMLGAPVIVKPNRGSLGDLVAAASNLHEVRNIAEMVLSKYSVAIVQEYVPGNDYRIVVLGGEIISAYQRVHFFVIGDGVSTIDQLIEHKRAKLPSVGRPNTEISPKDFRIDGVLRRVGLSRDSVLPARVRQRLLDNANLSTGGDAIDITNDLHPSMADVAIRASACIGVNLCGVDLICEDATKPSPDYVIIELNGAPGLDNYASLGSAQQERVDRLFEKVLRFLETHA
jgi:D-alanine-D-alanine ligase-like ATP-grasp enzyme